MACAGLGREARYVNMAVQPSSAASPLFLREPEIRRGVELLYFGYSHLTRTIDADLAAQGLGRAHHRALYFIARQPDMPVSDLLKLLAITKQSLGRVLTDLSGRDLVEQRTGTSDRRQRLLRLTPAGAALRGWRTFDFPSRPRVMQDEMRIVDDRLHDFLGRRGELEAQLELEVVDGALRLRTGRLWLNLGRVRLALPRLARIRLVEESVENGQRVSAVLSSPVIGDWFEYTGEFRYAYISS